jgi:hypothetical protein
MASKTADDYPSSIARPSAPLDANEAEQNRIGHGCAVSLWIALRTRPLYPPHAPNARRNKLVGVDA